MTALEMCRILLDYAETHGDMPVMFEGFEADATPVVSVVVFDEKTDTPYVLVSR